MARQDARVTREHAGRQRCFIWAIARFDAFLVLPLAALIALFAGLMLLASGTVVRGFSEPKHANWGKRNGSR
jgi:hypothetical protein